MPPSGCVAVAFISKRLPTGNGSTDLAADQTVKLKSHKFVALVISIVLDVVSVTFSFAAGSTIGAGGFGGFNILVAMFHISSTGKSPGQAVAATSRWRIGVALG